MRSLLLNFNGEPLQFIDEVRAIKLMIKGRAEPATGLTGNPSFWDVDYSTPSKPFKLPAVLRMTYHVFKGVSRHPPRFRKWVLFNRDLWKCQYCGVELNYAAATVDHIHPSSRGGKTTWRNCVAACKHCNRKKSNMTLEESKMQLLKQPTEPSALHFWDLSKSSAWHDDWSLFVRK